MRPPTTDNKGKGKSKASDSQLGPTFRHIYHRFLGPTYPGEFIQDKDSKGSGTFVLSYPGVAFNFLMRSDIYSADKDNIALMSKSQVQIASSMAVFSGESWADARPKMWTEILPSSKTFAPLTKGGDTWPDEVSSVRIHGGGQLQVMRLWSDKCNWIRLGFSREADFLRAFGAPDAIYRKNDHKMDIHKARAASNGSRQRQKQDYRARGDPEPLSDTDQSSAHMSSDGYDSTEDAIDSSASDEVANLSSDYFWNYFYLGFDVLFSERKKCSPPPPTTTPEITALGPQFVFFDEVNVATKINIHSNVPGSYPFNRHRRCRWEIAYLNPNADSSLQTYTSETPFDQIKPALLEEWKDAYPSKEAAAADQRGMVLNRGWGDSPGSSIEFMGGWEESAGGRTPGVGGGKRFDGSEESTTTLFGFPGLVFEVLRNGFVSALTVF